MSAMCGNNLVLLDIAHFFSIYLNGYTVLGVDFKKSKQNNKDLR